MKNIIRKILKKEINTKVINLILNYLKSGRIKPPYFHNLNELGLSDEEIEIVLSDYFNGKIKKWSIYNKKGNLIYNENYNGNWTKWEYDERGRIIYSENYRGEWAKKEFDKKGNEIYYENSEGHWVKKEFDENGLIYKETSDEGITIDRR